MTRPIQQVRIYAVQNRRGEDRVRLPYVVRYTIDGRHRSKSLRTKAEAERYRAELLKAVHAGQRFDTSTGEPESWQLPLSEFTIVEWGKRWLAEQWVEWQPRTRASATEALARFTSLAVRPGSRAPEGLRSYLAKKLLPEKLVAPNKQLDAWIEANSLKLSELDRETAAAVVRELMLKL